MRLILKLKSNRTVFQRAFLEKYYSAMDGFLYEKFSFSKALQDIHGKNSFKGFCFGNIYPVKEEKIIENKDYNLVISSPMPKIIEYLFFAIKEGSLINLGEGSFTVVGIEVINFSLKNNDYIETMSIINLTKNENEKILPLIYSDNKKRYFEQLGINIIKKYNQLRGKKISLDFALFENVEIKNIGKKEEYMIPIPFNDNKYFTTHGPKISFKFNNISDEQLAIFQVCFDAGFGERNNFGMGFMVKR